MYRQLRGESKRGMHGVRDRIQGHPRSLMLVPIDSAYATSY